jgi:hypothetical protein
VPPIPAPLATTKPIVGRRGELEALVGAVDEVESSGLRTVLVSGESGIGKTSLLAAVASIRSARSDWSVFYGRCIEVGSEPFQPFGVLLGQVVDALAEDEIGAHAARCGDDLARIVPQLRSRVRSSGPPHVGFTSFTSASKRVAPDDRTAQPRTRDGSRTPPRKCAIVTQ